ncbi:MAG: double-strand break repair protein AddB [Rhodobacter sp.]|nr:double-strand break repair protein AddB [Rhodobacter sp.]
MFESEQTPRVFALPPGVDFPLAVVSGLTQRLDGAAPEAMARTEVFVNTRRMQRRMKSLFEAGPPRLLPRIRLITDLAADTALAEIPAPVSPLRRRLELTQLIAGLLDREPDLAPRAATFNLADSLARLMDEMQGEGVLPMRIKGLDVSDQSGHWQRTLRFIALVDAFFAADGRPDSEGRQRLVVEHLVADWAASPPTRPVIVAGSTGSRGTTALFMRAVSQLPQGAVILPGFDFDCPGEVWDQLREASWGEDHPQFRFSQFLEGLNCGPGTVRRWIETPPPNPPRNRLVSLALRPAPVTDRWMTEGPELKDLGGATAGMTLIEAPSQRAEATAIAIALRAASEAGKTAALITPDRVLTRQVAAALDRWGIVPDDSAGHPLPLTAPGRLLCQVAGLRADRVDTVALLALLKHPLTNAGTADRGPHLLQSRELELHLRRNGPPFPDTRDITSWAVEGSAARQDWAHWLCGILERLDDPDARPLPEHVDRHLSLSEHIAAGPTGAGAVALWGDAAGAEALRWTEALRAEAAAGGVMSAADYAALFHSVMQRGEVRDTLAPRHDIMIWGTLEARVQGADLVILGSLNEGIWPKNPDPDPWLNRALRQRAGLLLPERQVGLAAHDFQQAIAAEEVILTRAIRDADSQTVPSRWLNRLTNLLGGTSQESDEALKAMRARGRRLVALAERLDRPDDALRQSLPPVPRPSPRPPVEDRPKQLSITEIQTLIRDPYAIYARHILRLRPLQPLQREPDARLRGTVLHRVLELFISAGPVSDPETSRARLLAIADNVLSAAAPWPATQRLWRAKLARAADWFIAGEIARQHRLSPIALERRGRLALPNADFTLTGKVDRIDRAPDGQLSLYDYKTGAPPSKAQQEHFDKQLALSAIMAERGAIEGIEAATVAEAYYIGLGANPKLEPAMIDEGGAGDVLAGLTRLVAAYCDPERGYTSRRAVEMQRFGGDYDHLARFGEWDETGAPVPMDVGQ